MPATTKPAARPRRKAAPPLLAAGPGEFRPADVVLIEAELRKIKDASPDGLLHKEDVVAAVKADRRHPLRRYYDWNLTSAFERYLLQRTGDLIRAVRIKVVEYRTPFRGLVGMNKAVAVEVAKFEERPVVPRTGGFVTLDEVRTTPAYAEKLLSALRRQVDLAAVRYKDYADLIGGTSDKAKAIGAAIEALQRMVAA